jgi:hypothetical protein
MEGKLLIKTMAIIGNTGDIFGIRRTAIAVESAYSERESGLMIGHCKSLIEAICKSILDERKVQYTGDSKVGKLAKLAVSSLDIAQGVENEKKAIQAFKKLINSFANNIEAAVQGIGELRNDFCPLAHGKSNTHISLDVSYAEFIAHQTDSLISFIYELRQSYLTIKPNVEVMADAEFDEYINEEFDSVTIIDDIYLPSEILFNINPDKYKLSCELFKENEEVDEE